MKIGDVLKPVEARVCQGACQNIDKAIGTGIIKVYADCSNSSKFHLRRF